MTTSSSSHPSQTTGGAVAESDAHSLSVGADGPIVLHDVHLVETLAHFNRENVVERRPHAKGAGAFGHFTVTHDVSQYTKAAVFQPGTQTKTLLRFSTVAGELGSPDTWRDVRGFSLRFYTTEGNYDLVGNNTPVFFLRDPIKFPHFIRSQKRLPASGLRDNTMQWDFWTLSPETAHQVAYLMGDRGLPKTWRNMNGYGSHTYMWVNGAGERFWVKYHFNPFDLTKTWSKQDYPLIEVGELELNQNPDNYFAQIEQAAFAPSNIVPGIGFSPDKMLLGRVFAYADAQRYRIGSNFHQLPVNQPIAVPGGQESANHYMFDGQMAFYHSGDAPVYAPNSFGRPYSDWQGTPAETWEADGEILRSANTLHAEDDDFGQAGTLVREVFDDAARDRLVETVTGALTGVTGEVLARAIWYWKSIDPTVGARIEANVNAR